MLKLIAEFPPRLRSGVLLRRTPTIQSGSVVLPIRWLREAFPTRRWALCSAGTRS